MAEFKKISDVDVINTLSDNDNVVIIGSDGAIKQTSSGNLGMDITKTEVIEEMAEDDKVVLVSNGEVKQVPVSKVGGSGYVLKLTEDNYAYVEYFHRCMDNYDEIYDILISGGVVWVDYEFVEGYPYSELILSYELSSSGLHLYGMDNGLLLPNGSHNLPESEK